VLENVHNNDVLLEIINAVFCDVNASEGDTLSLVVWCELVGEQALINQLNYAFLLSFKICSELALHVQ